MSDDDSFADGIRELLRNHNLSSSSFIRCHIFWHLIAAFLSTRSHLPFVLYAMLLTLTLC